MNPEPINVQQLLGPRARMAIYLARWIITTGLATALAALLVFGDPPTWFLAISAGWGVLSGATDGLAIDNVPTNEEI